MGSTLPFNGSIQVGSNPRSSITLYTSVQIKFLNSVCEIRGMKNDVYSKCIKSKYSNLKISKFLFNIFLVAVVFLVILFFSVTIDVCEKNCVFENIFLNMVV